MAHEMKGHIIVYQHANFRGAHRHIINEERNLNASDDSFLNDKISSFVILSGRWKFFKDSEFKLPLNCDPIGPGAYNWVGEENIPNDAISSMQCVG